jgi:Tol biopolymer transport system component
VVAGRIFFPANPAPTSPSEYVQITNFSDSAIWPSLSPDGRMVTFLRGGGNFPTHGRIYAKLLPNGEAVELTSGEETRFSPVFTPDGSRIAYTEVHSSPNISWDTWMVPTLGGSPSRFLPNASGLTWINPGNVLFSEIKMGMGLHMGIVAASEGRANEREIYLPDHERAMAHLSWASPDKKWALISEMDRTTIFQQCRLASLDGSSPGRLVGPVGSCTSAGWSPDGRLMYFSVTVDGTSHLWRQRFPEGMPEQITFGPTEEEGIAVAPDGRSLVSSVGLEHSTVWFHDAGGDRQISTEGVAHIPHLSRDGKRLYYLLRQHADKSSSSELRAVDLASNKTDNILPGLLIADYDISRDEQYVVYTTKHPGQEPQIWYASLDRRSPPRLIVQGGDRPSFGANDEIIFQQFGQKTNYLERVRIDGSRRERVIDSPILNKWIVSPDGAWAAVLMAGQEAGTQMTAIPLSGGEPHRMCSYSCFPQWSTDGKLMYITTDSFGGTAGSTLVISIPNGKGIPDLPSTGITARTPTLPNAQVIPNVVQSPGPDPSTYAFLKTDVQRNLFRIPLH